MKSLIILFCLLSISCFGQKPQAAIENVGMNALYRGFLSHIEVAVSNANASDVRLNCTNCDTIYRIDSNQYAIRPGKGRETIISVLLQKGDSNQLIKTVAYKAISLPDPYLFWGSAKSGQKGFQTARLIQAKYTPGIPIQAQFVIIKWTAIVNGESVMGFGSNLSAAGELIDSAKSGDVVTFMVIARGPDGISRQLSGAFSL